MNKSELFKKLQNLKPEDAKKLNISEEEIKYLRDKILNDNLGLTLNFTEMDNEVKSNYILLEELSELAINPKEKNNNLLIEGDNYHALKALQKANVKVDIIYIDPPYNTGKEFVYKDDFGVEKVVGQDDAHKHSKWLSFMKKRLELAKELLSDEGVIFVSIDDNEQAYLKILMDEIFGEENFISSIPRAVGTVPKTTETIQQRHDYVVSFKKSNAVFAKNLDMDTSHYTLEDERGKYSLIHTLDSGTIQYSKNMDFELKIFNSTFLPGQHESPRRNNKWTWRWSKQLIDFGLENNFIVLKNNRLYTKNYLEWKIEKNQSGYEIVKKDQGKFFSTTDLLSEDFGNRVASREVDSIGVSFDYPKPSNLPKALVSMVKNKNSVVLDFFAGSGTTGQAVMELNALDGGNRKFILITNNEMNGVDTIANPEMGIARSITWERLFRVINEKGSKNESIKWKSEKSLKSNSVKYLKVKLVDKFDGDFEEIDEVKKLYENEFDKSISISDFKE